jgi:hypothetical protein
MHDPYGFLKRHDPTLGPLAQSAVIYKNKRQIIILIYNRKIDLPFSDVLFTRCK